MPEIVIQPDGNLLVPRGYVEENEFFKSFLTDIISEGEQESLEGFFGVSEQSERIFGDPGLCG